MEKVSLNEDNEVLLKTTLTKYQVSKFNALNKHLVVKNGAAYVPLGELHGVLLTNSRKNARDIVNAHRSFVKNYLVPNLDDDIDQPYIRPIGLQILLEQLSFENPRRALDYRASAALLAYIVAAHPQLAFEGQIKAKTVQLEKDRLFAKLKKNHERCQLSGKRFGKGEEKHIHHIVAESINPGLAADEKNLVVISGKVHDGYHAWVCEKGSEISRASLKNYARAHGYDMSWAANS